MVKNPCKNPHVKPPGLREEVQRQNPFEERLLLLFEKATESKTLRQATSDRQPQPD